MIFKASTPVVQYMQSIQVTFISVKSFVSPLHQQSSSRESHIMRFFYLHPTRFAYWNGAEKSPMKAIFGYDAPEPIAFASVHHCILQCVRNDDRLKSARARQNTFDPMGQKRKMRASASLGKTPCNAV